MTIFLIVSIVVLVLSGLADYFSGRKAAAAGGRETNSMGPIIGSLGSTGLVLAFGCIIGFGMHGKIFGALLCLGFAAWHTYATVKNVLVAAVK